MEDNVTNTTTASATTSTITRSIDAIELDVSVLKALLERNQSSHGRTLYFQRISMAVRALQRYNVLGMVTHDNMARFEERMDQLLYNATSKQQQQDDQYWDLRSLDKEKGKIDQQLQEQHQELISDWNLVEKCLVRDIPEVLSRIRHASQSLYIEISRGYFIPLCVVALASLSRIFLLLQRLGSCALTEYGVKISHRLKSLVDNGGGCKLQLLLLSSPDCVQRTLALYAQDDWNQVRKSVERQYQSFTRNQTFQSLGLCPSNSSGKTNHDSETTRRKEQAARGNPSDTIGLTATVANDDNDGERRLENIIDNAKPEEIDVGFAVVSSTSSLLAPHAFLPQENNTNSIMEHEASFCHDEMDTNMRLVHETKSLKKKKKKREKSGNDSTLLRPNNDKRARESDKNSASTTKKKKQKVAKKKKEKKDFFDELFGK